MPDISLRICNGSSYPTPLRCKRRIREPRGFFVDRVNQVRRERGLDARDAYKGLDVFGEVRVFFENRGWTGFIGIRKKITYPLDEVRGGGPLPK